jgi:hypothetical protein
LQKRLSSMLNNSFWIAVFFCQAKTSGVVVEKLAARDPQALPSPKCGKAGCAGHRAHGNDARGSMPFVKRQIGADAGWCARLAENAVAGASL